MKGNILVLRNLKKDSPWCDKDRVMLYACFQLLMDFLEKEKPQKIVDYVNNRKQKKTWKELQSLSHYWKMERPRAEKEISRLTAKAVKHSKMVSEPVPGGKSLRVVWKKRDDKTFKRLYKLEDNFEELEERMLFRLLSVRKQLWC